MLNIESFSQLAKRKADELEDFGGKRSDTWSHQRPRSCETPFTESGDIFSNISKEETDEGTLIVEEFLRTWKTRVEAGQAGANGDDVHTQSKEYSMEVLKEVVAEYRDKFEGNAWVKAVLDNL